MTDPTPQPTPDPTPSDPQPTPDPKPDPKPEVAFTAEQEAELNRRIAAARRAAESDAKTKAKQDADEKRQADEAEAERQKHISAGEFDKVKTSLEADATAAKAERDDFKTKHEAALAVITPMVDVAWKDLPEEVTALYAGAEDDVLARFAHIERTKGLVEKLTGTARGARVGSTPRPNGDPNTDDQAKRGIQDLVRSRF